ncbi:acyl carrier protein [Actinomadura algeriensis]|uniref:Act minimal PKS acyl carrier protein n=1 Tax=Actinomadura algeriensis TaxID=1679523 RepID=A0ABR9JJ12_9ACTN|nr:phosphopantetheine-binding protein [Actinomadura algeriensis]MBE1530517.1 act minimal PKS acyl carrier protein [Actinomadura algeriensis]
MTQRNLDDLRTLMRACVGEGDGIDLDGDILDLAFSDMQYDSLAVLELAARIETTWGVPIPEEEAATLGTPGAFLDYVNRHAARTGAGR